jgi:hypothetical protein
MIFFIKLRLVKDILIKNYYYIFYDNNLIKLSLIKNDIIIYTNNKRIKR